MAELDSKPELGQAKAPPSVIAITAADEDRDLAAVNALFEAGCELLHLRKPGWSAAQLQRWIDGIHPNWRQRLTLHGSPEYAVDFGCGGVHHPQASELKAYHRLRRSSSWHRLDEPHDQVDYGFLSPIWPSTSKPGYGPSWSR